MNNFLRSTKKLMDGVTRSSSLCSDLGFVQEKEGFQMHSYGVTNSTRETVAILSSNHKTNIRYFAFSSCVYVAGRAEMECHVGACIVQLIWVSHF
mmetsp:Transcript_33819/g.60829  ORF Transcript_33819/g.60829 Transcript_33819/m.60829 type:complete len:95 (-) Transcript_33819:34-318(-)